MNRLQVKLELSYPIVQAPMAGVTTPAFVVAAAEAGILGSIGAGYLSANETRDFIREVRALTKKPFAVNLFIPEAADVELEVVKEAAAALESIKQKLGIVLEETLLKKPEFAEQIQTIIDEKVKICSFTFGLPDEETVQELKKHDVFLIGTATTVEEAMLVEQAGMDAIVVQGIEAGGHRGSFAGELQFIPLDELLTHVIEHVQIPIIAAGGIATRTQMERVLKMGAVAVQIGTALLAAHESGAHPVYKESILQAKEGTTTLTKSFSGKCARGIHNCFMEELKDAVIAPYPIQNSLTKKIRTEAAKQGKPEYMSLWAGESVHLTKAGSMKQVVEEFLER